MPICLHSAGCFTNQGSLDAVVTVLALSESLATDNVARGAKPFTRRLPPRLRLGWRRPVARSRHARPRRRAHGTEVSGTWTLLCAESHVTAIVSTLTSLPFTQLRRNRYFYLWYDGFYAALCVVLLVAMRAAHHAPLIGTWDHRYWVLLPLVCHAQILCSVWIHNATHNNFPRKLNRLVGELCGVVVLTRFASWEVIHQRHHRYSDNVDRDPHPVVSSSCAFLVKT